MVKPFLKKIENLIKKTTSTRLSHDANIANLMKTFNADEYGHRAMISQSDLGYGWIHYGIIRAEKSKNILCVGSRHGFIPAVLGKACQDNGFGHVDFVDAGYDSNDTNNWTGVGYWRTKKGKNCFNKYGLGNFVSTYVMTTKKFAKKYNNNSYDYIYIDGDHSYSGVRTDFSLFFPMLSQSGFMSFHDICVRKENLPEGQYGVWKLWRKLKKNNSITFNFSGSGLGILQKTSKKNNI